MAELVPLLRHHGELDIDDDTAALLMGMSAAVSSLVPTSAFVYAVGVPLALR